MDKSQVSVNFEKRLKDRLEEAANARYLSLAAFIRLACVEYADKVLGTEVFDDPEGADTA